MTCACTSIRCQDYRQRILAEAADRITERPEVIRTRRDAAQFLYWVSSQIVTALDQLEPADEED